MYQSINSINGYQSKPLNNYLDITNSEKSKIDALLKFNFTNVSKNFFFNKISFLSLFWFFYSLLFTSLYSKLTFEMLFAINFKKANDADAEIFWLLL